jgi:hypothetical protein
VEMFREIYDFFLKKLLVTFGSPHVWWLLYISALHCHLQGAFLVPSERCSIEEQSIEYCGWARCVPQLSISKGLTARRLYKSFGLKGLKRMGLEDRNIISPLRFRG